MQLIHAFARYANPSQRPAVCTIGSFDGVHVGHQQLIRTVVSEAHTHAAQSIVITFHPHPREVLGAGAGPPMRYLTTPDEQAEQMRALGIDTLLLLPFTVETSRTPAIVFVEHMLAHLRMLHLWIGPDFALGYKRQGNAAYLAEQGRVHGFAVNIMPQLSLGDAPVSSSRIRAALARGDVRAANLCLGRAFAVLARRHDAYTAHIHPSHALPAAGRYPALVQGRADEVTVAGDSIIFSQALCDDVGGDTVKVEFV
jgi:riboflavin kinase/FMN adenylyltransferase